MIFTIAVGFVCGVFLLAAIVVLGWAVIVIASKYDTFKHIRTRKKYDFEEDYEDEFDEYN